jgi:dextranase
MPKVWSGETMRESKLRLNIKIYMMKCKKLSALFFFFFFAATTFGQQKDRILLQRDLSVSTDKASYQPGETVRFTLEGQIPVHASVRYFHQDKVVDRSGLTTANWTWKAPQVDFKGYLAEIYTVINGREKTLATVGIDVSSSWTRFPRYGFLSKYPAMEISEVNTVVKDLNRYHINGLQFYDWHYKHHQPLASSGKKTDEVWNDIANRPIHLKTIKDYILIAHQHNMKAMFYNLVYGALKDASIGGVADEWYMYDDKAHQVKEKFALPDNFNSDIFFTDPANTGWQNYIDIQNKKVYAALDFDGFHMDQVGNRDKQLYDYQGKKLALDKNFEPFIKAVKQMEPDKSVVMNAVNQYGQQGIANAPVDFLYTEVWAPNDDFTALAKTITDNDRYGNYTKRSVLAAYMNYDRAEMKGEFNTASILMADALIFAYGGSHLELGEHMLCKEYFPNDNLSMKPGLKSALVNYYDFLVAYENLLRGPERFKDLRLQAKGLIVNNRKPTQGEVTLVGKSVGNKEVVHLLNYKDAVTMSWRDPKGIQAEAKKLRNISIRLQAEKRVKKVWFASPDVSYCLPTVLKFKQEKDQLEFVLPVLKYWDMLVIEFYE